MRKLRGDVALALYDEHDENRRDESEPGHEIAVGELRIVLLAILEVRLEILPIVDVLVDADLCHILRIHDIRGKRKDLVNFPYPVRIHPT